jgi:Tfp pilus assembly PilM family ATPase
VFDLTTEDGLAEGLQTIFADASFRDAIWASAVTAGDVSFRPLQIPIADKRKIRKILPFEVEPLLPMSLEDVFVDCIVNPQEKGARVIAAAAPRSMVIERIGAIAAHAGSEGILDCGPVPVAAALLAAGLLKGGEVLLDIGTEKTAAVFIGLGMIVLVRHYAFGGGGITRAIASDLGISHAEAEEMKRSDTAGGAGEAVRGLCESFLAQLSQTLDSLWWNGDWGEGVTRIILTGEAPFTAPWRGSWETISPYPSTAWTWRGSWVWSSTKT